MAWIDWENKATNSLWTSVLDELEAGLGEAAGRALSGAAWTIERTAWDSPDLALIWSANGLDRNVHMYFTGTDWPLELHYEGAAWSDQGEERNLRTWPSRDSEGTVPLPDMAALRESLKRDLPVAIDNVNRLVLGRAMSQSGD